MSNALSSINIRFKVDLTEFSSQMQNVSRQVQKSSASFKNIGANLSTYVTLPVLAAGGAAVKFASDYEESLNKVNVAFGDSSSYVENWAKSSLDSFGIAEGSALDMASLFGDMATSMGLPQKEAAKMSTSLTGLAGDLASFKNIGIAEATTALNGIFTGETESLKRLGVVMTEANLKTFAYSQGITKQIKDMTEAEKVNLRYAFVLSKTKNAQGDFERTGGGAANQMRVFTESLKQVGQQLGAVILPIFTKVITFVNEKIKAFSNLSETSKILIVSIAGVAAAIGPLLSGLGSVLGFLPNIISSVKNVGTAWSSLTTLLAANPFTAIAAVLATIVGVTLVAGSRFTELTNATAEYAKVSATATQAIAKEKVELDRNLATAKNEKLSKEERKKAIQNLNAISPEYLGNLSLENINTKAATDSVLKYNQALLQKAKVMAAEEKLVEVQKKLLDLQLGQLDAVKPSVWQNLGAAVKSVVNPMSAYGLQVGFSMEQTKIMAQNLQSETSELTKLQQMLVSFLGTNKEFTQTNTEAATSLNTVGAAAEKIVKPGTVAYFEQLKSKLEEQQKTIPTTNAAWLTYEERIKGVQDKIDALTNTKLKLPELPEFKVTADASFIPEVDEPKTLAALNLQKQYYEGLRSEFSETAEQYKVFSETINGIQLKINTIEGVEEVKTTLTDIQKWEAEFNAGRLESMKANQEAYASIGQSLIDVFGSFSQKFVDSLGIADEGMKGFVSSLVGTITKLISMALSASMANSIQGATQSAVATGPGAVFTQPAFLATAITGIISAFASIPKFEFGGIVGGSSFYGDKILARVNSGELILNQKQQANVFGMLSSGSGEQQPIVLNGGFKLSGSELELVIERAIKKNNRTR
jgi:hypothetical protein